MPAATTAATTDAAAAAAAKPTYKARHNLQHRMEAAAKATERHPDCMPVICEQVAASNGNAAAAAMPALSNNKFLVTPSVPVSELAQVLRTRLQIDAEHPLVLTVAGTELAADVLVADLYAKHKDEDGFLYVTYSGQRAAAPSSWTSWIAAPVRLVWGSGSRK
jgi:GABA(A) receptor-associated protein